ncbi:DnaJ C-terminal domain-containing protein [Nitrospira lenta]|uniref:Chaperone protein DnaJ n=1 Tax=Nitrospira lenta TaxID=1436998 RepID=A0A330L9X0_9BACT|nr:DnaJ C-terminal domain-containing protein [Nitrospira lenta]SPP65881.1 Curved DNA-binding protein [Nitrospira lenta]
MANSGRDYYQVLGLPRTASADEIKKAYRRLARQFHPDMHSGAKKTEMEKKFKEMNEAHEVLSDPDKRKKYDQHGTQWEQAEAYERARQAAGAQNRGQAHSFSGEGFSDIFENLFGGRGRAAGQHEFSSSGEDLETEVDLSLREVLRGVTKRINLMEPVPCSTCRGSGAVKNRPCQACLGSGHRMESTSIEVKIPAGVQNGTRVRVPGKGQLGTNGGRRGDLYLHVTLMPNKIFRQQGTDLHANLPVWPWEAALGAEVMAPTLTDAVRVKIPAGSRAESKLRLKGKGLPTAAGGHGDLFLTLQIVLPSPLTEGEQKLYEQLSHLRTGDPRAELLAAAQHN